MDRLLIGTFLLALCLPTFDRMLDLDPSLRLAERRSPTSLPDWPKNGHQLASFAQRFERYYNENFGFRRLLIRTNSWARFRLGVSSTPLVVIGKNDWIYYTGDSSMDAYQGLAHLEPPTLEAWRVEIEAREALMTSRGGHFLFVVVPDKQTTYPAFVPDRYARAQSTLTDQLIAYLVAHSKVKILDLRQALEDAKSRGDVFWRTDSHWNDRGMYFAYVEIINRLRQWYPQMAPVSESEFTPIAGPDFSGDLSALLGLVGIVVEKRLDLSPRFAWLSHLAPAEVEQPAASAWYSEWNGPSPMLPRAVIFHDSYLLPTALRNVGGRTDEYACVDSPFDPIRLLAGHFSHSFFTWQYAFDKPLVDQEHPDLVIEEVAERALLAGPK